MRFVTGARGHGGTGARGHGGTGDTVALSIAIINLSSSLGAEYASQPGSKCIEVHKVG